MESSVEVSETKARAYSCAGVVFTLVMCVGVNTIESVEETVGRDIFRRGGMESGGAERVNEHEGLIFGVGGHASVEIAEDRILGEIYGEAVAERGRPWRRLRFWSFMAPV